jgi:hypothetical protein
MIRLIKYWDDGNRAGVYYLAGRSVAHVLDLGTLRHVRLTLREADKAPDAIFKRQGARLAAWIERKAKRLAKFPVNLNRAEITRACEELRK